MFRPQIGLSMQRVAEDGDLRARLDRASDFPDAHPTARSNFRGVFEPGSLPQGSHAGDAVETVPTTAPEDEQAMSLRGITWGVVLSVPLWAVIAAGLYALLQ